MMISQTRVHSQKIIQCLLVAQIRFLIIFTRDIIKNVEERNSFVRLRMCAIGHSLVGHHCECTYDCTLVRNHTSATFVERGSYRSTKRKLICSVIRKWGVLVVGGAL